MISLKPQAASTMAKNVGKSKVMKIVAACAAVAVLGGVTWGIIYFQSSGKSAESLKKDLVQVKQGPAEIVVLATGVIRPDVEVKISPKLGGLLKTLLVKQGDIVKAGQLIAVMDDSNVVGDVTAARGAYLSTVDNYMKLKSGNRPQEVAAAKFQEFKARNAEISASRNISRMQAQVDSLTAQLKRDQTFAQRQAFLATEGAVSDQAKLDALTAAEVTTAQLRAAQQEREQAEAALDQSHAELNAIREQHQLMRAGFRVEDISAAGHNSMQAKGQLIRAESLLNDTRIRAPFDGVVTQKYADAGAFVTPTTSAATTSATSSSIIALAGKLKMVAQVAESNIPKIVIDQPVVITATAYPDKVFKGRVTQIAPAAIVTQNVTTFEVHVEPVDDSKHQLLAGMNVSAKFIVGKIDNAITVPTVSVVSRKGQAGVFVPDEKGEPVFKPVKTGTAVGREIVILSGLKANDQVFLGLSKEQLAKQGYGRGGQPGGSGGGSPLGLGGGGGRGMRGMGR